MSTLLLEFNDRYFRDVASSLIKKGVQIDYIITSFPKLYSGFPDFKKTKIIDENQFFLIDNVIALNKNNTNSLSENFIKENYELECVFLKITDRLCFYPKTVRIRQLVYYELLLYWKNFFENNNIKTIVYPRVPHLGYGNIVLHLAKRYGINVLIIKETSLDNKTLIESDFNKKKKIPLNYLPKENILSLEQKIGKELLKLINLSTDLMDLNRSDNKTVAQQNNSNILQQLLNLKNYRNVLKTFSNNPFKRSIQTLLYLEPPTTWFKYYIMLFKHYLKNARLLNFYKNLIQNPNYSSNYIYFPLHYQPERTTLPEGGVYEDMLLIVDIIVKSLPKNWYLYIKEHPYQFSRSDPRRYNFRDEYFYSKIFTYKKVKMISQETPSLKLIKNSMCVATVTGTSGWESLLLEKPVLLFSYSAWYSPCNSCFNISSLDECKEAINKIQLLTKEQVKKSLLRFLIYYKNKFINVSTLYFLIKDNKATYKKSVETLTKVLVERL